MTEKRFTYDTTDLNFDDEIEGLVSLFYDNDKQMTYAEVLDKLNELAEENKELKVTNGEMEDYLARMEEENKELRSDRDYWKTLAQSLAKTNGTLKLKDEHIGWKRVDVE